MQETMTIKEVEEVIKMKLFTFISDYKGGTYISQYVAKTLEEALNLWINNVDFFTDKQLKKFKKNIKNVIYDYEFWKKAVIIDTKLALLCVREKTGQPVAFLQI